MLILISDKQDPAYAMLLAAAQTLNPDTPEDGLHYGLDEPYEGSIDNKFDDAYVEYKRQVDIVNNHNDYIEDMESLIKSLPMPGSTRCKLLAELEDGVWELPEEPNEQDYL